MRVIRILVYEGEPEVIDQTFRRNGVKSYYEVLFRGEPRMTITEAVIGYKYPNLEQQSDANQPR